jgi:hypothetical protein
MEDGAMSIEVEWRLSDEALRKLDLTAKTHAHAPSSASRQIGGLVGDAACPLLEHQETS